jgi:hypothetical protein
MAQNFQNNVTRIETNKKYIINVINIEGNYITPIGWSSDGYFADEVIERYIKDSMKKDITSLDVFWVSEQQRITNILEQNNIISCSDLVMENPNTLKSLYGFEIEFQEILYPDSDQRQYDNLVIKNTNGRKRQSPG